MSKRYYINPKTDEMIEVDAEPARIVGRWLRLEDVSEDAPEGDQPEPEVRLKKKAGKGKGSGRPPKLTPEQQEAALSEYRSGAKPGKVAAQFKVPVWTIYDLIKKSGAKKQKGSPPAKAKDQEFGSLKIRTFVCSDKIDCGESFKKNTVESEVPCVKCGLPAYEMGE